MTMSKYVSSLRARMTYFTNRTNAIADNKLFISRYLDDLEAKIRFYAQREQDDRKFPPCFRYQGRIFRLSEKELEELAEMLFYLEYKPGSFSTRVFSAREIFEIIISYVRPNLHQVGEVGLSSSQIYSHIKDGNKNFFHSNIATLGWRKRNFAQLLMKNISDEEFFLPLLKKYNKLYPLYLEVKDDNANTVSSFIEYKSELHKVCDEFLAKDFGVDKGLLVSNLPFFSAKDLYDKDSDEYKQIKDFLALEEYARNVLRQEGL